MTNQPIINGGKGVRAAGKTWFVMAEAHTDAAGKVWPAGTEYRVVSGGKDSTGRRCVEVLLAGARGIHDAVKFYERA